MSGPRVRINNSVILPKEALRHLAWMVDPTVPEIERISTCYPCHCGRGTATSRAPCDECLLDAIDTQSRTKWRKRLKAHYERTKHDT